MNRKEFYDWLLVNEIAAKHGQKTLFQEEKP
jgi:hypothetical protein